MPLYDFRDEETEEEFTLRMSYNEKVQFLEENPTVKSIIKSVNIVAGVGGIRNDGGWKETLSKIADAHPSSALADRYGNKTAKQVKTNQAVEKWRKQTNLTST